MASSWGRVARGDGGPGGDQTAFRCLVSLCCVAEAKEIIPPQNPRNRVTPFIMKGVNKPVRPVCLDKRLKLHRPRSSTWKLSHGDTIKPTVNHNHLSKIVDVWNGKQTPTRSFPTGSKFLSFYESVSQKVDFKTFLTAESSSNDLKFCFGLSPKQENMFSKMTPFLRVFDKTGKKKFLHKPMNKNNLNVH